MQWTYSPLPRFSELTVTLDSDFRWYVSEPFTVEVEEGEFLTIRPGFRTDFASIPAIARPLFRTWGRWTRPAVLHDYFYRMGGCTRELADRRFRDGLEAEGVSWLTRQAFYYSVRGFGWLAWERH